MGADSVQTFNTTGAGNLATDLGGSTVLGTLDFNASADVDVSVRLADLPAGGTQLYCRASGFVESWQRFPTACPSSSLDQAWRLKTAATRVAPFP